MNLMLVTLGTKRKSRISSDSVRVKKTTRVLNFCAQIFKKIRGIYVRKTILEF